MNIPMHGAFHWNELRVRDQEKAKEYYADLLGWEFETVLMEETKEPYLLCKVGEQPVAGIMEMSEELGFPEDVPPHWLGYICVDDVDVRVARARDAGGTVLFGPFDAPGVGRFAVIIDSTGAHIGLITPVCP